MKNKNFLSSIIAPPSLEILNDTTIDDKQYLYNFYRNYDWKSVTSVK